MEYVTYQACIDHGRDERMAVVGRFPRGGVRFVGAVKWLDIGEPRLRGTAALVRLRVRTNSGVRVPAGQSTGCP
jgi:hypothetical protein